MPGATAERTSAVARAPFPSERRGKVLGARIATRYSSVGPRTHVRYEAQIANEETGRSQRRTGRSFQDPAVDIQELVQMLEAAYGPRTWRKRHCGIDGLVQTILSQNTSDANSSVAFCRLKQRFPNWEAVLAAPISQIERAIRTAGLSRTKAPRIKAVLRRIKKQRGRLCLAFLARLPLDEARAFLESLPGVGPKTACCVLMFCYGRPALPVDTHVHRVSRRLGLVPARCTAESAHELLQRVCPPELVYPLHVLMIEHGRRTCRARSPACERCVLADRCDSFGLFTQRVT